MIRHCNGEDPNLQDDQGNRGNCGARFDDVNHWVLCPHLPFDSTNIGNLLHVAKKETTALALSEYPAPSEVLGQPAADPWQPETTGEPAADLFEISLRLAGSYEFDTGRAQHTTGAITVQPLMYCTRHPHGEHWTWATDMRATLEWIEAHEADEHGTAGLADEWAPHHHHPLSSDPCATEHHTPIAERHIYGVLSAQTVLDPANPLTLVMDWHGDLEHAERVAFARRGLVVALPIVADYRPVPVDHDDVRIRDARRPEPVLYPLDDEDHDEQPEPTPDVHEPAAVGRAAVPEQRAAAMANRPRFFTAPNGHFPTTDWRPVAVRGGGAPRWTNDAQTDAEIARRARHLNAGETLYIRREKARA